MNPWTLVLAGCGTVGYWACRAIARSPLAASLARSVFVDCSRIRPVNAVTCPAYAAHAGRPKCERLAELAAEWSAGATADGSRVLPRRVETLDWDDLLESPWKHKAVVVAGLDAWEARLILAEDARRFTFRHPSNVILIQCGLDRDKAAVAVFGSRFEDPCPAEGMSVLPGREACVAYDPRGRLLRGDLRREAGAAARLVVAIIRSHLRSDGTGSAWVNTKTNLVRRDGNRFERTTRACRRAEGCFGPHGAESLPLRWDGLLAPLAEGG